MNLSRLPSSHPNDVSAPFVFRFSVFKNDEVDLLFPFQPKLNFYIFMKKQIIENLPLPNFKLVL